MRRWRLFSVRYGKELMWVERWLHMIDRSLTKQPAAAAEIVQTASMIQGYGDGYRQGLADWHAIIDGLAKPTFDGALPLPDLAAAIVQARAVRHARSAAGRAEADDRGNQGERASCRRQCRGWLIQFRIRAKWPPVCVKNAR